MKHIMVFGMIFLLLLLPIVSSQTGIVYNEGRRNIDYNSPPNPPEITGPSSGKIRNRYFYSFLLTDPDEYDMLLTLEINWSDGEIQREGGRWCLKPWPNGSLHNYSHMWMASGEYQINARVQDVYGDWSNWSEPFQVTMPKSINYLLFLNLFKHRLGNFFLNSLTKFNPICSNQ